MNNADKKWKWAVFVNIDTGKCAGVCKETLREYRGSLVEYRCRTWHLHCLLDYLTEKDPPETPVGMPDINTITWNAGWGVVKP